VIWATKPLGSRPSLLQKNKRQAFLNWRKTSGKTIPADKISGLLLPACITSVVDLLDIVTSADIDMLEEELSDELYCSWLIRGISNNNSINSNEGGNGDNGGNGDDGSNGEEGSSVHFPDLIFASFKATELTLASVSSSVI
jgi:hypothetical protein